MNYADIKAVMTRTQLGLEMLETALDDWLEQLVEGTLSSGENDEMRLFIGTIRSISEEVSDDNARIKAISVQTPVNKQS